MLLASVVVLVVWGVLFENWIVDASIFVVLFVLDFFW